MSQLLPLSIGTALLCGIWVWLSGQFDLLTWGGFAGCTSFFAAGGKITGLKKSLFASLSGVFWAAVIIWLSGVIAFQSAAFAVGLVTFCMCYQSRIALFSFIPGTFIGCFSTFAANGDYKIIVPALILGIVLGFLCEHSGSILQKYLFLAKAKEEPAEGES